MTKEINLDSYRRRAKELLKLAQAGDKVAVGRIQRHNSDLSRSKTIADVVALKHAQHVIARETGFSSWLRLKGYVATLDRSRKQHSPERLQNIIRSRDLEAL